MIQHVCVLGAGVIGVTTAYRLLQSGHRVTLVDECGDAGQGASFANGAQLSYSYVAPLADASVWHKWPYYLWSSNSPLSLKPSFEPTQWHWLLQFLGACTFRKARETTVQLLRLASYSRQQMADLLSREAVDFHHRVAGKLVLCSDAGMLESARRQVAFQARHGSVQRVLSIDECVDVEPAIGAAARNWIGGIYTADEEVGDCAAFCRGLVAAMRRNPNFIQRQGRVRPGRIEAGRMRSVLSGVEHLEADAFVLALGAHSAAFARSAGFKLPVYPLKGYSISLAIDPGRAVAPHVSLTDLARKIVYARVGNTLRVAGRVELTGMDTGVPQRAIDELKYSVAALFPSCAVLDNDAELSPWGGLRPATPSGLPLIGSSPLSNLYLNVGHGSLGWTLACGSASLIDDYIARRVPQLDMTPFRIQNR